jgi:signal transduction histidine kinase/ligand-binding sensor domain-containing protein/CheY-like chemotaxis protein
LYIRIVVITIKSKYMKKAFEICFLFLLFIHIDIFSQFERYRFTHITTKDGLPHSLVFSICQAQNGFIWFGTNNGLARFDGYNFKLFQPEYNNPDAIAHKSVFGIIEDDDCKLWLILQTEGVDLFDPATGIAEHFPGNPKDLASPTRNANFNAFKDRNGQLWFCSNFGLSMFNKSNKTFIRYKFENSDEFSLSNSKVYHVADDEKGNLWIATERGISLINKKTRKSSRFFHVSGIRSILDSTSISQVLPDRNGFIWICTYEKGLWGYDPVSKKLLNFNEKLINNITHKPVFMISHAYESKNGDLFFLSRQPSSMMFWLPSNNRSSETFIPYILSKNPTEYFKFTDDINGNFWISAYSGLYELDVKIKKIITFTNNPFDQTTINCNQTRTLFLDNKGILWVSVYKVGVDKIDLFQKKFIWFNYDPSLGANSLPENNITSMLVDKNKNIWIGTMGNGVAKYNSRNQIFTQFKYDANDPAKISFPASATMLENTNGDIWIGSLYGQIDIVNPVTETVKHLHYDPLNINSFSGYNIRKLIPDKNGNIWIASATKGLVEYDTKKNTFIYHSKNYDKTFLEYGFYRTCYIDSKNRIWVGTQSGGLLLYNAENNKFSRFTNERNNKNSLCDNTVYSIYFDKEEILWIGTANGLNSYNEKEKKFEHFSTKDGLPNNTIYSIINDEFDNLWISTDNGLSCFSLATKNFVNYYESDGLICNEFNSNSYFKDEQGKLFFGTPKGMIEFAPSDIIENKFLAKPKLTILKILNKDVNVNQSINGRIVLQKDISESSEIELSNKDYAFTIEFSAMLNASPEKIKYRYILENFENDWIETDASHRFATYSNLPAGKYVFKVKATNCDGKWCNEKDNARLKITIIPPFWKSLWTRSVAMFILLVSAFLFYLSRIKMLRRRHKKLEIMVSERTRQLEESNAELEQKQEEILMQKDTLEEVNKILKEQQERILAQNIEIDKHRHNLEHLIEERTRELNEARLKAIESDKLKSAFLANISHEIRTPMNAIVGFSNLLTDENFMAEQRAEFIELIKKNSELLLILIDDILDISKIQSNQLVLQNKPCNLKHTLTALYKNFEVIAKQKHLGLSLNIEKLPDNYLIETEPLRFKQVISNLLSNAMKFTDEGSVEFGISAMDNHYITFFVKDTGIGIPSELQDIVFSSFTKIEIPAGKTFGGIGLGLSICKSLIDMMGGKIWFMSAAGSGTTFYFTLPNIQIQNIESDIPIADNTNFASKVILIAEDEEANFRLLQTYLSKYEATIIRARNGLEAVEIVQSNESIHVVLMDIKMPVMDGATATRLIRELRRDLPIIAQTAYAMEDEIAEYKRAGFNHYIVKPIKEKELIKLLLQVIK